MARTIDGLSSRARPLARGRAATNLTRLFVYFSSAHMLAPERPPKDDLIHGSDHNSAKCVPVKWDYGRRRNAFNGTGLRLVNWSFRNYI